MKIKFRGILTEEAALEVVKNDPYALRYCQGEAITEAVALEVAKNDPGALRYCQGEAITEAVALEAAKNNPDALRYVLRLDLFLSVASKLGIEVEQ